MERGKISSVLLWVLVLIFGLFFPLPTSAEINSASKDVDYWLKELKHRKVEAKKKKKVVVTNKTKKPKVTVTTGKQKSDVKKISVDFYKVDLHNVFRLLGQVSGKNIVVDEGVKGTLTLALENVPWTFVLDVIKSLKGLSSIERNNTIMIYPKGKEVDWIGEEPQKAEKPKALEVKKIIVKKVKKPTVTVPGMGSMSEGPKVNVESIMKTSKTPLKNIMEAEELIKKAARQERHGNLLGAYQSLKKAVKLWPDNLKLNEKVAAMALKQGDLLDAFNYAKQALRIYPKSSTAASIAAVALAKMERYQDAKTYFEMAMANNPDKDTLWNYAVFLFSQGDYRDALRLINRIEAKYTVDPEIIMLKAQCYEYLAKPAQALVEYRSLISSGQNVPKDLIQFAQLRIRALASSQDSKGKGR